NKIAVILSLQHGCNPNATNRFGDTCLHEAVRCQELEIIDILMDQRIDLSISGPLPSNQLLFSSSSSFFLCDLRRTGPEGTVEQLATKLQFFEIPPLLKCPDRSRDLSPLPMSPRRSQTPPSPPAPHTPTQSARRKALLAGGPSMLR